MGILGVFNYKLLKYGIQQLTGQYKIVSNSIPINEYASQNDIPDSIKFKLSLIAEAKEYAFENLALKYSENYSTIYDQQGKPLMWLLTASLPFKMVAREWSFPLVGAFSYKGFFNQKSAEKEFEELKLKGWDVLIREVGGWSTLGWFKDPVLSEMLNRSTGKLAELIIHELTHGTLYIKDSVEFNENLASFVGIKGTEQF